MSETSGTGDAKFPTSVTKEEMDGKVEANYDAKTDTGDATTETIETKEDTSENKAEISETNNEDDEMKDKPNETKDESGETKDESGEMKDETSETKDETSETKDETSETKDETRETKDETSETKDETKETKDETSETNDETIETKDETSETKNEQRTCIVGMDGSEHSEYAMEWFLDNAYSEGDRVVLVYVPELHDILHSTRWTISVYPFDKEVAEDMVKDEHARIKEKLDIFADIMRKRNVSGKVESIIASKPGEGILKAAEFEKADLIILGSRGQNTLRRTFMGSISDYVVHHSDVPVLVCKHPKWDTPGPHPTH